MSSDPDIVSARAILSLGLDDAAQEARDDIAIRDSADETRFTPGTVVADRFRVTALVGRGGMGDVYRADDLKLGQPVALKFLPESLGSETAIVRQFYDEVRLGRQVAHPNVCRIYDLLEVEGRPAIVMEFVDGENLASLLERTGRLPYRTAVQIARDICAGVEAAHERGVIHGDLKPANVMIDGRGRARISDFGLSRLAGDAERRGIVAGTPAYMPPEQFRTGASSERADLYSLGAVLYEIFTGVRPWRAAPLGASHRDHDGTFADSSAPPGASVTAPSALQPALDPELERTILRCLESDPRQRPASARAIRAAFPPGDILDDVIAAGETPPSEFVAESGKVRELRGAVARAVAACALVMLIAVAALSQRLTLYGRSELQLSPAALTVRARAIAQELSGSGAGADEAIWFDSDLDYRFGPATSLPLIVFNYRGSGSRMLTLAPDHHVHADEPPLGSGMVHVVLDPAGRLLQLRAVPSDEPLRAVRSVPWPRVLRLAAVYQPALRQLNGEWVPAAPFDERRAWIEGSDGAVVRATSYRGRITSFAIARPPVHRSGWTMRDTRLPYAVYFVVIVCCLVAGGFLARRHLRGRRVDVAAAWRIAAWVFACRALYGLIAGHHPLAIDAELTFLTSLTGVSLLLAAQVWLGYVALEPYMRRRWPEAMIGWARLVHGRFVDPVVGRDILLGVIAGLGLRAADHLRNIAAAVPSVHVIPSHLANAALISVRETVGGLFLFQARAIFYAAFGAFALVLLRMVLRRGWLAAGVWLIATTVSWMRWDDPVVELPVVALQMVITLVTLQRAGLLAMMVAIYVDLVCVYTPLTLEPGAFYFPQSMIAILLIAGLVIAGLSAARQRVPQRV